MQRGMGRHTLFKTAWGKPTMSNAVDWTGVFRHTLFKTAWGKPCGSAPSPTGGCTVTRFSKLLGANRRHSSTSRRRRTVTRFSKLLGANPGDGLSTYTRAFPSHAFQNCLGQTSRHIRRGGHDGQPSHAFQNCLGQTSTNDRRAVRRPRPSHAFQNCLGQTEHSIDRWQSEDSRHTLFKTAWGKPTKKSKRPLGTATVTRFSKLLGANQEDPPGVLAPLLRRHTLFKTAWGKPGKSSFRCIMALFRHTLFKTAWGKPALMHILVKQTTLTSFASAPQKYIKGCAVFGEDDLHKPYLSKAYLDASAP